MSCLPSPSIRVRRGACALVGWLGCPGTRNAASGWRGAAARMTGALAMAVPTLQERAIHLQARCLINCLITVPHRLPDHRTHLPAETSEVMQQQQLHSAAAAAAAAGGAAAEYGGPRPPAIETAISGGSVGSPLAGGGKSPLGPGSRTVRCGQCILRAMRVAPAALAGWAMVGALPCLPGVLTCRPNPHNDEYFLPCPQHPWPAARSGRRCQGQPPPLSCAPRAAAWRARAAAWRARAAAWRAQAAASSRRPRSRRGWGGGGGGGAGHCSALHGANQNCHKCVQEGVQRACMRGLLAD